MMQAKGYKPLIAISFASFLESIVSPIPVDPVLVTLLVKRPEWRHLLWICVSLSSICGAVVSYGIGYGLFSLIGEPIIAFYHLQEAFTVCVRWIHEYGLLVMLLKPFLPFPFKLAAMVFGVVHYNFFLFLLAVILTRPIRFYVVSCLVMRYGMRYKGWILKNAIWMKAAYIVAILASIAFLAWRAY